MLFRAVVVRNTDLRKAGTVVLERGERLVASPSC